MADSDFSKLYTKDYDAIANVYSKLRTARYYDKDIAGAMPKYTHALLDLGCADGKFALSIAERVTRVVGIDASDKMIELASKNKQKRLEELAACNPRKYINVRFCKSTIEKLDKSVAIRGMYDAIVANRVLHHCDEDIYAVIRNLKELLALGGKLIVLDLSATGNIAKQRRQRFLKRWYTLCLFLKGVLGWTWNEHGKICWRLPVVLRDLKQERSAYASEPWKQHLSHEPNFHWKQIYRAMDICGLSPRAKRRNGRFMLIVGQLRAHRASPNLFKWTMRIVVIIALLGIIHCATILEHLGIWQGSGLQSSLQSVAEWLTGFWKASSETIEIALKEPLGLYFLLFSAGATFGAWLWGMNLRSKWRRGPVEDRPGIGRRFSAWLTAMLKLGGWPTNMGLWAYYRGKTNCITLLKMEQCQQFLKEHFGTVEGQIWIHRSDLRALIDEEAFNKLYKDVIDKQTRVEEVRIILEENFLESDRLTTEEKLKLAENLGSMERRSIVRYRYIDMEQLHEKQIVPKEMIEEFKAYTSDETFIFYTEGEVLPNHQTVCVNRCAFQAHRDQGSPLRIVLTAMRKWSRRRRGQKDQVDLEPLEKFMNRDLQRVFQDLFADGNKFKPLYKSLMKILSGQAKS